MTGNRMLSFDIDGVRFNYRIGGICIHRGHVLLTQLTGQNFWYLPGGRCEPMETSVNALDREIEEELGTKAQCGKLLLIVENFYHFSGRPYHELAFYYEFCLPESSPLLCKDRIYEMLELDGTPIRFRWVALPDLDQVRLVPGCLGHELLNPSTSPKHIIHFDGDLA